tara:strand:- start:24 stop:326 length:303 start_codon:yes stop_codon:yes gene_type:complete
MIRNKIIKAIKKIKADAQVSVSDDDINTIVWENGETPISKADIEAKMAELQTEYDAKQYQRDRQAKYPNELDCIHALLDGGDTLTDLQAKRQIIKDKYPK